MILFLAVLNIGLTLFLMWDQIRKRRDRLETKKNSVVFGEIYNSIWREAAQDWLSDLDDKRTFENFLDDTIKLIRYGP